MSAETASDGTAGGAVGAVLVAGGGVGGIQTSLDLAGAGYKVYLVEEKPAIGGVMAQLDKTFPTNDCSLCILSPKLVEVGRHPNIELLTNSRVEGVEGSAGNFKVSVTKKARYVTDDCVGCGLCSEACVMSGKFDDEFDEQLRKRSAVYIPYPQAVPLTYIIDPEDCLLLSRGKCSKKCEEACPADAIDFEQKDEALTLDVGAVIMAPGFEAYDARKKSEYGYGRYPNVVTSLEFERVLSASGPFEGHVVRPSDREEPAKVAWIQCVGSRDNTIGNNYCSSVCCTYAIKEAIIAKEHLSTVEPAIFHMDVRTHGKDFEAFYNRARDQHGIRFVRCRISHIREDPDTDDLFLHYEDEEGNHQEERFNMVVLSVGMGPGDKVTGLADRLGVEVDRFGFCRSSETAPMDTSVPGIFACGAFSGPKDIPETVMEASGAAARASGLISDQRNTLVTAKVFPEEKDVTGEDPRIGVFVCHCGINIGAYVDVPAVVEYARGLPNVALAEETIYACSQDAQQHFVDVIKENDLNRLIVASCTPRTHEPLFQETVREAGLNPYLFEMANIRDQCSWVHQNEPEEATAKARDLVRMAVAKSTLASPLPSMTLDLTGQGLVVGGGVAGMTAALGLAKQGFDVFLVEKEEELGGNLRKLKYTLDGLDVGEYLASLVKQVEDEPRITVYAGTTIGGIGGFVGNFKTMIEQGGEEKELLHGAIIVATGASESKPAEYLYGEDPAVVTQLELEEKLAGGESLAGKTVAMIQCVGSREEGRPYCSRICCSDAVKNALKIKETAPDAQVFLLFRDMRTYGLNETYYEKAREAGVIFVRYEPEEKPGVTNGGDGLEVVVRDRILNEELKISADMLVLSSAVVPPGGNGELAKLLKVPLNSDGFFLEAHVKLRPVDFATEGIFLAGMAHSPKSIGESVSQALAASSRAGALLGRGCVEIEPTISEVNSDLCIGCGLCESLCPYRAIEMELVEGGKKAKVISASCKGCGVCGASCPVQAITMRHFTNRELKAQIDAYGGVA